MTLLPKIVGVSLAAALLVGCAPPADDTLRTDIAALRADVQRIGQTAANAEAAANAAAERAAAAAADARAANERADRMMQRGMRK